jgi:hypothetical protein
MSGLCEASTGAILGRFLNTASVKMLVDTSVLGSSRSRRDQPAASPSPCHPEGRQIRSWNRRSADLLRLGLCAGSVPNPGGNSQRRAECVTVGQCEGSRFLRLCHRDVPEMCHSLERTKEAAQKHLFLSNSESLVSVL